MGSVSKKIVIYDGGIDENSAEYLADFFNCPTIENKRPFYYDVYDEVFAVGGSKKGRTGYLDTLITGSDRYDTFEKVINYILDKRRETFTGEFTVTEEEKQFEKKLVIYNNYIDKRAAEYLSYKLDCQLKENRDINVKSYDVVYFVGGGNSPSGVKIINGDSRYLTAKAVIDFMKLL